MATPGSGSWREPFWCLDFAERYCHPARGEESRKLTLLSRATLVAAGDAHERSGGLGYVHPSLSFELQSDCVVKTPAPSLPSAEHVQQIAFVLSSSETVKCQQLRQMFGTQPRGLGNEDAGFRPDGRAFAESAGARFGSLRSERPVDLHNKRVCVRRLLKAKRVMLQVSLLCWDVRNFHGTLS